MNLAEYVENTIARLEMNPGRIYGIQCALPGFEWEALWKFNCGVFMRLVSSPGIPGNWRALSNVQVRNILADDLAIANWVKHSP